jgi:GT2 family glycosyltransferase
LKFSVIVPTYNRRELLAQTLRSVCGQVFRDYEVIVVDDGSDDGTEEWIRTQGSSIRFLQQRHGGPGAARNLALQHATGDYIAFLDSDDLWFPWSLQLYAQAILNHSNPAFITGKVQRFHDESELAGVRQEELETLAFADYLSSGDQWRWYGLSSFVIKRELIQATGGFPQEAINGEDSDLALRLGTAQGFIQITAPTMFGYREHAGGIRHVAGKNLAGDLHRISQEEAGRYPGGAARAKERWRILTPHLRTNSLECLQAGLRAEAWEIFRRTLRWNLALGRWRYLAAFPLISLLKLFGRKSARKTA